MSDMRGTPEVKTAEDVAGEVLREKAEGGWVNRPFDSTEVRVDGSSIDPERDRAYFTEMKARREQVHSHGDGDVDVRENLVYSVPFFVEDDAGPVVNPYYPISGLERDVMIRSSRKRDVVSAIRLEENGKRTPEETDELLRLRASIHADYVKAVQKAGERIQAHPNLREAAQTVPEGWREWAPSEDKSGRDSDGNNGTGKNGDEMGHKPMTDEEIAQARMNIAVPNQSLDPVSGDGEGGGGGGETEGGGGGGGNRRNNGEGGRGDGAPPPPDGGNNEGVGGDDDGGESGGFNSYDRAWRFYTETGSPDLLRRWYESNWDKDTVSMDDLIRVHRILQDHDVRETKKSADGPDIDTEADKIDSRNRAVNLMREAFRRQQQVFKVVGPDGFRGAKRLNALGQEQGVLAVIMRHKNPEVRAVAGEMTAEADARAYIHDMWVGWESYRTNLDKLAVAMGASRASESVPQPEISIGELDFGSLAVLAEADEWVEGDKELGKNIGRAIQIYIESGERHLELFERMLEEERQAHAADRSFDRGEWWKTYDRDGRVRNANVFSTPRTPAELAAWRERVAQEAGGVRRVGDPNEPGITDQERSRRLQERNERLENGRDAEELAFRIMYLLGYAGKYNIDQNPACARRDALATLMYPNEALQGARGARERSPGPRPIVGEKGKSGTQPLRDVRLLLTYPELLDLKQEDKILKGEAESLHGRLRAGRFDEVDWRSIGFGYGAWTYQVGQAKMLYDTLRDMEAKIKVFTPEGLAGFHDNVVAVMKGAYRPGGDDFDLRVNHVKYYWAWGVIDSHDPRNPNVSHDQMWDVLAIEMMMKNMREAKIGDERRPFLPKDWIKKYNLGVRGILEWGLARARKAPDVK